MVEVTEADRDFAARMLGYANWSAIFNAAPRDSSGVTPTPSHGLRYSAERGAKLVATHREAAAKAERDRLRDLPDDVADKAFDLARVELPMLEYRVLRIVAAALAAALEKHHD